MTPSGPRPADGAPLPRVVQEEDALAGSRAWQARLRVAAADLDAGRVRRFDSDEEFLEYLGAIDDEAE